MSKGRIIAGIDVGSAKTTTIIASAGEEGEPKIIGVASTDSKGIRKGQIVDIEEATAGLVQSVEAAERMAGYNLNRVFLSVSGSHLASSNSTGVVAVAEPEEEISAEDIKRVVEAAKAISLPSSREIVHVIPRFFTVDGQKGVKDPAGMSGVRLEVETHIITAASTALRNLSKCVGEIGASIEGLVASGLAAAESVLTETEKELGVVLVDIGAGITNVVVFVEGAPFYYSVLPIGAKNITNDLAIGLRICLESAEKLKVALSSEKKKPALPEMEKEAGLEETEEGETDKTSREEVDEVNLRDLGIEEEAKKVSRKTLLEGIIKPRLNEIFNLVGTEIRKSEAAGLTPAGLVVCGGGARTAGAIAAAKRSLAMPVRIGQPQGVSGLIDEIRTADFAVATGLILHGVKTETRPAASFSLGRLGKSLPKIPVRGLAGKAINLVKSFLP